MIGKYTIKGMHFHAFHGSHEVEREFGLGFDVDATVIYDVTLADVDPKVNSTVHGADIHEIVTDVMMNTKFHSRTSLGLEITKRLFKHFKDVKEIGIKISRSTLFIPGDIAGVDNEVWCKRSDFPDLN